MRLSNRNKAPLYNFIYTNLIITILFGIVLFFLERYKFDILGNESTLFIIIPVLLGVLFYFSGRQIFEYDSDGEALHFKNRNVLPFLNKPASDEFPKYKLKKYEIFNALFIKKLYITISSKKTQSIILKYDISFLTKKEIKDLKFSLSKVIKENKEAIEEIQ